MDSRDLDFFTCKELIDELMRRKTFLGVILHCEKEVKGETWSAEQMFKVHFNANIKTAEVSRLLDHVSSYIHPF